MAVVAMEVAPLLLTMGWIVGGIEIDPDLRRWLLLELKEAIHKQPVHAPPLSCWQR
jgi:hypothetical protein